MSHTLEQKREAVKRNGLWVRFPESCYVGNRLWSLADQEYLELPTAVYFIGPTPPRVLSELEGELLEALKGLVALSHSGCVGPWDVARAAIQKAEGTA
jgi:hypothetical protein